MNGWQSRWLWQRRRTTLHEDRSLSQSSGRRRSTRRTTAHGHRSDLLRGSGQASSRSLGRSGATAPCGALRGDRFPTPGLPVLAGASGEAVDASTLSFLTAKALEDTREEEARMDAKKEAKRRKKQDAFDAAMGEFRTLLLLLPPERETPETLRRLDELHQLLYPPQSSSSRARRKRKKRRRKRTRRARFRSCSS